MDETAKREFREEFDNPLNVWTTKNIKYIVAGV